MNARRICKLAISVLMAAVITMTLVSCTGTTAPPNTESSAPASSSAASSEPANHELTGAKKLSIVTVPAGAPMPDGVTIMDSEIYTLLQEKTGYELDWTLFKSGTDADEQITLLLASKKAPDMIQGASRSLINKYAAEGGLCNLEEALPVYAPFLNDYYGQDVIRANSVDGKLYYLPRLVQFDGGVTSLALRKDILDELQLDIPTTPDEIYSVLKTVKEKKPDMIPYVMRSHIGSGMTSILGAFGIPSDRFYNYLIEDGRVVFPYVEERGAEFLKYAAKLYADGLMDSEFLLDQEPIQKMISGQCFMMEINYVEIVRQMSAFKEKNPDGEWIYIEAPKGKNGEQGILPSHGIGNPFFIIPKTSEDKVPYVLDLLNIVNSNEDILDIFALGIVGRDAIKNADGTITKTDSFPAIAGLKGYYSRLDLTDHFDTVNNILEGFDKYIAFTENTVKPNELQMAPANVPASADKISNLTSVLNDDMTNIIVDGYTDEAFENLKQNFKDNGGEEIMNQYQEWYDSTK